MKRVVALPDVPDALVRAIRTGRCIAFVGAGFVQPALPSWPALLAKLAKSVPNKRERAGIQRWLKQHSLSSRDYEGIAECIQRALGEQFATELNGALTISGRKQPRERLKFLDDVPFQAVLTTNFDNLMKGDLPGPKTYASILTAPRHSWWNGYYWDGDESKRPCPCVKLHGTIDDVGAHELVFTTREYRKRLHKDNSYRAFLRALFATHVVLYMGFSFTDAYVNELRSEVLEMLGLDVGQHRPLDYAIMADVSEIAADHLLKHEGLQILPYSTEPERGGHAGFDKWLDAIRAQASPEASLRNLVKGKRMIWFDPQPHNNRYGLEVLGNQEGLIQAETLEEAIGHLQAAKSGRKSSRAGYGHCDLVITRFGWREDGSSDFEHLLKAMRSQDLRAPVIVFASGYHRDENRPKVLAMGAYAYTDTWEELFRTMEELFS
jgi:hypothetical protein